MATKKSVPPAGDGDADGHDPLRANPLIAALEEGAGGEEVVELKGLVGQAADEGTVRLYDDLSLGSYVELPRDAVITAEGDDPTQPVRVFVRASTGVRRVEVSHSTARELAAARRPALAGLEGLFDMGSTLLATLGRWSDWDLHELGRTLAKGLQEEEEEEGPLGIHIVFVILIVICLLVAVAIVVYAAAKMAKEGSAALKGKKKPPKKKTLKEEVGEILAWLIDT